MKRLELVPLVTAVFQLIRSGVEHYATLTSLPPEVRHSAVSAFLRAKVADLDPTISGIHILNDGARDDLASFAAHVSLALGSVGQKGAA